MDVRKRVCIRAFESIYAMQTYIYMFRHLQRDSICIRTYNACVYVHSPIHTIDHSYSFFFQIQWYTYPEYEHKIQIQWYTYPEYEHRDTGNGETKTELERLHAASKLSISVFERGKGLFHIIQSDAVTRIWPCSGVWSPSACLRREGQKNLFFFLFFTFAD
jgi:hypothetical protein